jgi:NADH dehydrogenase
MPAVSAPVPAPLPLVIVGAGYAGVRAALTLDALLPTDAPPLLLLNPSPYHHLITRLPELVGGRIPPERARVPLEPLLRPTRVRLMLGTVLRIDLVRRALVFRRPDGTEEDLHFGILVLAAGSVPAFHEIPGLPEHAWVLRTLDDALRLRARVRGCAVRGGITLIAGGGYTGVELAGELAALVGRRRGARLVLVEAASHLLPGMDEWLGKRAAAALTAKGVEVQTRTALIEAGPGWAVLRSPAATFRLHVDTLIWAGGSRGPAFLEHSGLPLSPSGLVQTGPSLEVPGVPGIYAGGDCAIVRDPQTGRPLHPSAQYAVQHGEHIARAIVAELRGLPRPVCTPREEGEAISLGPDDGVAWWSPRSLPPFVALRRLLPLSRIYTPFGSLEVPDVGARIRLTGRAALVVKRVALERYLYRLGGIRLVRELSPT